MLMKRNVVVICDEKQREHGSMGIALFAREVASRAEYGHEICELNS